MIFEEKVFTVFDKNTGEINVCGRDACKALMAACSELYPDKNFGDIETGYMNIDSVKSAIRQQNINMP